MKNIVAIARKELASYFNSPIAYIVLGTFLDMAANLGVMSDTMKAAMGPVFERYGVAMDNFAV